MLCGRNVSFGGCILREFLDDRTLQSPAGDCSTQLAALRGWSSKDSFCEHVFCEHDFSLWHVWHDLVHVVFDGAQAPNTSNSVIERTQTLKPTADFRNGFTPGLDLGIVSFLMTVYSLWCGLVWWGSSGILLSLRMLGCKRRRLRRIQVLPRRRESVYRMKVRDHWARVNRSLSLSGLVFCVGHQRVLRACLRCLIMFGMVVLLGMIKEMMRAHRHRRNH